MDQLTLAYLAGALDADGSFGIKRSTYARRVRGDAHNPVYSERVMLKQVTPQVPELLRDLFGGRFSLDRPSTKGGRPLYNYQGTDKVATSICEAVLPYLRIKRRQAELLLELRETKDPKYRRYSYWFEREFPNWQEMELITTVEAAKMLGYTHEGSTRQAIGNGTLLALPWDHVGRATPRIPKLLVERLANAPGQVRGTPSRPPELIAWRQRLCDEVRKLNKIGVNGTAIYHRTGYHKPVE